MKCIVTQIATIKKECIERSSKLENHGACRQCRSPWRVCLCCVRQGEMGRIPVKDMFVVEGDLCRFHTSHGPEAHRREKVSAPVLKRPTEKLSEEEMKKKLLKSLGMRIEMISVDEVRPFEGQPRFYFDPDELKSLSKSMKKKGQHIPVIVIELEKADGRIKFEFVDGERRWRSAKMAGETHLVALVTTVANKEEQFVKATIANLSRSGHTPLEEALAIRRIMDYHGYSGNEISDVLGLSPQTVYNRMKLLELHPEVHQYLRTKNSPINATVAMKLQKLIPYGEQPRVALAIMSRKMDTNSAENLMEAEAKKLGHKLPKKKRTAKDRLAMIKNFVSLLERGTEKLLDFSEEEMRAAIKLLMTREHEDLKRRLKEGQSNLTKLCMRI